MLHGNSPANVGLFVQTAEYCRTSSAAPDPANRPAGEQQQPTVRALPEPAENRILLEYFRERATPPTGDRGSGEES
ncbi:hypothetical protein ACW14Y_07365 [Kitasatospora sp. cg17-2]